MIDNLNSVLHTIGTRSGELSNLVSTLQELVSGLAADRQPIGSAISAIASLSSATAGLLQVPAAAERSTSPSWGGWPTNLANNTPTVNTFLKNLPLKMSEIARLASYGSWLNFFMCDALVSGVKEQFGPQPHRGPHHRGEVPVMKPLSERNPIAVAIVGLLLLAVIAFGVFDSANLPIIGGGTGYTAYFAEDAGLQAGNEVRVAGVIVGRVTGISLAGNKVAVGFKVKGAWVGDDTKAAIKIKTLLGDKYLALDPLGTQPQNPATPIPLARTTSPYDVTQAFNGLGQEVSKIDTVQLGQSLQTLSEAFSGTPPYTRSALRGLACAVPVDRLP